LKDKGDETGGVILFVTDGKQDCKGGDKTELDDPALLRRVKDSKARIITVAFGYIAVYQHLLRIEISCTYGTY
jgi:hypothetical protein